VRLRTQHGPVHLWWPADYDANRAGVVVYVHGYFIDVDRAWRKHHLAEQFAASHLNAVFVACEAPKGPRSPVHWTSLGGLLDEVDAAIPGGVPRGRVTALGHSGAHRTITRWLDDKRLDTIVLLDALYDNVDEMREWVEADPARRLIDTASLTKRWAETLHAALPDTVIFEELPAPGAGKMRAVRSARVIYVRTDEDHMRLVTDGVAIPLLLHALQLPLVEDARSVRDAV